MATYDLAYPGAAIDAILNTAYYLQEAGYIFRGSASDYAGTPSKREWVIAPAGFTGYGISSPVPQGSIGICLYNGTSWVGKIINVATIDSTPTQNSGNAVSSGGAYAAINQLSANVTEALENLTFTDTTPSAFQDEYINFKVSTTEGGVERILTYLTILAATTEKAGLMSAEDKAKVDSFLTGIRSMQFVDATTSAEQSIKLVEQLKWTVGGVQEVIDSITLLAATSSKAGLLSASDKAYIDALPAALANLSNSISAALALMEPLVGYYVCDTAAAAAAKVVSATGYKLTTGGNIRIKMANANTADSVTLNINSTGEKSIYYKGQQVSSTNSWKAGEVVIVYYDGEKFVCDNTGGMGEDEAIVISDALNELKANEENTMDVDEAFVISTALNDLHQQIEEGGGGGGGSSAFAVSGEVTIANSERITVVGSSFGTGSFNLAGKSWSAKLALFSDYQFENISFDGFNYISILRYLRLGQLSFRGRYALLCNNENNGGTMAARLRSLQNIATWMKTFGAEPILATSYPDLPYQSALWKEYADRNNHMFWDVAKYCSQILNAKNAAWDGARHLATRNSQMVTDGYMPYMLAMERPRQSIKVFRIRSFVDYTNLDDLMFMDNGKRAEMFMELFFGTACNTTPSSVDNINACTNAGLANEYRSLQGSGVLFSAPFLISAVIPVNASDLEMLSLNMSAGKAVKVYVMNRKKDPFPYGGNYTRFSVSNEVSTPSQGAVYSTGGTNYTVVSVVYGENGYYCTIYCSPEISSAMGAGTLTKVSGDGASSIPFALAEQSSLSGDDVAFTDTVGHWEEITASGGLYSISGTLLKNCVEIDTIHFLVIPQDTDCLISNIAVKYGGKAIKPAATRRYFKFENSDFYDTDELVQEPTFGTVGTTQTVWKDDAGDAVTSEADYEGKYPAGSSVIVVDDSTAIRQTIPSTSLPNGRYVLQVVSRYFPPIYTNGSGNQITPDSFDYETLNVTVGSDLTQNNSNATLVDRVGTYWKISQFEIDLYNNENITIRVSAGAKGLEVCKVSLKRKGY